MNSQMAIFIENWKLNRLAARKVFNNSLIRIFLSLSKTENNGIIHLLLNKLMYLKKNGWHTKLLFENAL